MNYEYCDGITHTVKKGDTLYGISRQHNVPLAMILRANPYVDVYNLRVGDTICVPVRENTSVHNNDTTESNVIPVPQNIQNNMPQSMPQDMPQTSPQSGQMQMTTPMPMIDEGTRNQNVNDDREQSNNWVKYVAQPGDTMQDILDRSGSDMDEFWNKNAADKMYMLPGIAYYILESDNVEE